MYWNKPLSICLSVSFARRWRRFRPPTTTIQIRIVVCATCMSRQPLIGSRCSACPIHWSTQHSPSSTEEAWMFRECQLALSSSFPCFLSTGSQSRWLLMTLAFLVLSAQSELFSCWLFCSPKECAIHSDTSFSSIFRKQVWSSYFSLFYTTATDIRIESKKFLAEFMGSARYSLSYLFVRWVL